jgi:hypothetical protein
MLIEACFERLSLTPMCLARHSLSSNPNATAGPLGFWRPNERAVQRQERSNRDPQASFPIQLIKGTPELTSSRNF